MKKATTLFIVLLFSMLCLFGCNNNEEIGLENYEIGPDRIPSISFVLGEREIISNKTDEDNTLHFTYKAEEKGHMEVYEYMSYLIDNCGGVVTSALNEGESGKCEIAVNSDENGYVISISFEYEPDKYSLTVKRVAGKIKLNEN